jgi:hypothetical protein
MARTFKKIVTDCDLSKFKTTKSRDVRKRADVAWENLWYVVFGFTKDSLLKLKTDGNMASATDYAWTAEAKEKFYSFPLHAKLRKHKEWGWFVLQCEPCDYNETKEAE